MKFIIAFTVTILVNLYLPEGRECRPIQDKVSLESNNNYVSQLSQQIDPVLDEYKLSILKQNTLQALEKLTQNVKEKPLRMGKQDEDLNKAQLAVVGASLKIANAVVHSIVSVIYAAFRPNPNSKSPAKVKAGNSITTADELRGVPFKNHPLKNSLTDFTNSMRDKSYADQLTEAIIILADQDKSLRTITNRETIKLSVDYISNYYIATNGPLQALFLPKLFAGIQH